VYDFFLVYANLCRAKVRGKAVDVPASGNERVFEVPNALWSLKPLAN
jgi:hypothetical protein